MARRLISRGSLAARPPADGGVTGVLIDAGLLCCAGVGLGAGLGLEALGSVLAGAGVGAGAAALDASA